MAQTTCHCALKLFRLGYQKLFRLLFSLAHYEIIKCSYCVCALSRTLRWELCALGCPFIVFVSWFDLKVQLLLYIIYI
jgi:hypothetical protein